MIHQLELKSADFEIDPTLSSTGTLSLFNRIKHLPWPLLLHSSSHQQGMGRYDIFTANPRFRILSQQGQLQLIDEQNNCVKLADQGSPFAFVKSAMAYWQETKSIPAIAHSETPLPGAYGYFGYDLARSLEKLPTSAQRDIDLAELAIGLYETLVVIDHQQHTVKIISVAGEQALEHWHTLITAPSPVIENFSLQKPFDSNFSEEQYQHAFNKIHDYIHSGDCYQINLAQRFQSRFKGDPWHAYCALAEQAPTPYGGFFKTDEATLLSLSPEQFIGVQNSEAQTKPIKGTIKRSDNNQRDMQNLHTLKNSGKDQAENLMIVDLLRNDFSKLCEPFSVKVEKLFDLESFSNVHHLVSTITGKLPEESSSIDLLESCFPGGSITGAPKIRAMEIIDELETARRTLYCGSLGYWDIADNLDTNILIRSFLCKDDDIYCWAGGGIVADSTSENEYQETFDKVTRFIQILENLS